MFACLDWMARFGGSSTVTVNRLATSIGAPGRAFRLNETELVEILSTSVVGSVSVTAPAGVPQLVCEGNPNAEATNALRAYYTRYGHSVGRRTLLGEIADHDA